MAEKTNKKYEDYFKLLKHKLPYWNELPEIELYMDQLIDSINKYLSFNRTEEDPPAITHAMINNYVKLGIIPPPVKKKYSREHVAYLIIICCLKPVLPISYIKELIEVRVERTSIEETLNFFSDLYDDTLNTVIAIGRKFSKNTEEDVVFGDAAIFLAIGSSGSKYIAKKIVDIIRKNKVLGEN